MKTQKEGQYPLEILQGVIGTEYQECWNTHHEYREKLTPDPNSERDERTKLPSVDDVTVDGIPLWRHYSLTLSGIGYRSFCDSGSQVVGYSLV